MTSRVRRAAASLAIAACSAAVVAALAAAPASAATSFGELGRFGGVESKGEKLSKGPKTDLAPFACEGYSLQSAPESEAPCELKIAVDPAEGNTVFLLDEYAQAQTTGASVTRFFRLQKIKPEGSAGTFKGKFEGEATFSETGAANEGSETELTRGPVELTVDPKTKKVYVLISDLRAEAKPYENDYAAAELLAFSTTATGEKLEPAGLKENAGKENSIVVGRSELEPEGNGEHLLLNPTGITADPYKGSDGSILILAHKAVGAGKGATIDPLVYPVGSETADDEYDVSAWSEETGRQDSEYTETGETLSGTEYGLAPDSITVAGSTEAEAKVLVNFEGLVELPTKLEASEDGKAAQVQRTRTQYTPAVFGDDEANPAGGQLSAYGSDVFSVANLDNPDKIIGESEGRTRGIFERTGVGSSVGRPIGWTGGQTKLTEANEKCDLSPWTRGQPIDLAAGANGDVFALVTEWLTVKNKGSEPKTQESVIEFGPGGEHCPTSEALAVRATVGTSTKVEAEGQVAVGHKVTYRIPLKVADQNETVWTVREGTTKAGKEIKKVTTRPEPPVWSAKELGNEVLAANPRIYAEPVFEYTPEKAGKFIVEAEVKTDNLNTPTLTKVEKTEQPLDFLLTAVTPQAVAKTVVQAKPAGEATGASAEGSTGAPNLLGKGEYPLVRETWSWGDGTKSKTLEPETVSQLALGGEDSCALLANAKVECWGAGKEGQAGNAKFERETLPGAVEHVEATQVAVGGYHACALLATGKVDCWGRNTSGQLGRETKKNEKSEFEASAAPAEVAGLTNVKQITAGKEHSCALLTGGEVDCWGKGRTGQLGNGLEENKVTPVAVSGLSGVAQVAAGALSTCARLVNGHVDCWGSNGSDQLGDGHPAGTGAGEELKATKPVEVAGITEATSIAAGGFFDCALLEDGKVKCWGQDSEGELGNGAVENQDTPVEVKGLTEATQLTAGTNHACVVVKGGTVECWGKNYRGQLGDGKNDIVEPKQQDSLEPVSVSNVSGAKSVAAGLEHTCVLLTAGHVECWGAGAEGELGDAKTEESQLEPAQVAFKISTFETSHTYLLHGTYKVKLEVEDSEKNIATHEETVTIEKGAKEPGPLRTAEATLAVVGDENVEGEETTEVTFESTGSRGSVFELEPGVEHEEQIKKTIWKTCEGAEQTGPTAHFKFKNAGSCEVKLEIEDAAGDRASADTIVTVLETPAQKQAKQEEARKKHEEEERLKREREEREFSLSLAGSSIKASGSGAVAVVLDCSGNSTCSGTISGAGTTLVYHHHKYKVNLGSARFFAAAHHTVTVVLHLAGSAKTALKHVGKDRLKLTYHAVDAAGEPRSGGFAATLKKP